MLKDGYKYLVALGSANGELTEIDVLQVVTIEEEKPYKKTSTYYKVKGFKGSIGWIRPADMHMKAELGVSKQVTLSKESTSNTLILQKDDESNKAK